MSRTLRLSLALAATTSALLLAAPTAAHADVTNITIDCHGASGRAGAFVTQVQARIGDREIGKADRKADQPYTWSIGWTLEGDHVVTLWDRTAGNDHDKFSPDFPGDTSHGGPDSNIVGTFKVSCPIATTTTAVPTTSAPALATTAAAPATTLAPAPTSSDLAATSTDAPTTTQEPVATIEPTDIVPVDEAPETSVTLGTAPAPAPAPSSTVREQATTTTEFTFSGHDDFYVADPGPTTMPTPVLSEVTTPLAPTTSGDEGGSTSVTVPAGWRSPETGTDPTGFVASAFGLLGAGGVLVRLAGRRRNLSA